MKQLNSDKYNVAWYKLAEFVVRKEKERALALLRLLTHSFDDQALKDQLEGDLLRSFDDYKNASEKYFNAAQHYAKEGKLTDSAALYELLISLNPKSLIYLKHALIHYKDMGFTSRIKELIYQSLPILLEQQSFDVLDDIMSTFGAELEPVEYHQLLINVLSEMITHKVPDYEVKIAIKKTLTRMNKQHDKKATSLLLSRLKDLHQSWYDYAELIVCEL